MAGGTWTLRGWACLLGALFVALSAGAAERRVPETYSTIALALGAAQSGDVVLINSGFYQETVTTTKPGITFRGMGETTEVSASGAGSPFHIRHDNTRIENLTVRDAGGLEPGGGLEAAGVYVDQGANITLSQVFFKNCTYGLICGRTISGTTVSPRIERGQFESCTEWAVDVRGPARPTILNSLIIECQAGVRMRQNSATTLMNNTIVACTQQGVYFQATGVSLLQNNNVCYNGVGFQISTTRAPTLRGNNASGNSTSNYSGQTPDETNFSFSNPGFINPQGRAYHLQTGSACKDRGWGWMAPYIDFDGDERPLGTGVDIGYDEVPDTGGYHESILEGGTYGVHDLFALLNGGAQVRSGTLQFMTSNAVRRNLVGSAIKDFNYNVVSDGSFAYYGTGYAGPVGFWGTVGAAGLLPIHGSYAAPSTDAEATAGYAGYRLGVRLSSAQTNARLTGTYSVHALLLPTGGAWRTVSGTTLANGAGVMVTQWDNTLPGDAFAARRSTYTVAADGRVAIDSAPSSGATLESGGSLLVQNLDVAAGADPRVPQGYRGLALYLRRGVSRSTADFNGTYRLHELRALPGNAHASGLGVVLLTGTGNYSGDLLRNGDASTLSGKVQVAGSGLVKLNSATFPEGTLGLNNNLAVFTQRAGQVSGQGSSAWMQLWLRTQGLTAAPPDTDADGLTNAEEATLGTNASKADTDGDGIPDGADAQPTIANTTYSAAPTSLTFNITQGQSAPAPQNVAVSSNQNPFLTWSAQADKAWVTLNGASGVGDGSFFASIDPAGLTAAESPYTATLTVDAQGSGGTKQIPITVNVAYAPPSLTANPTSLTFFAFEGGGAPTTKVVALSNTAGGPYTWTATTLASWITVSPPSGTADGAVQIGVNPDGLTAAGSPYVSSVRFTAPGGANNPVDVAVSFEVAPGRELNQAFPVAASTLAQSVPAVAYDATGHRYGVVWVEGGQVRAQLLDETALPLGDAFTVSDAQVVNNRPAIAANPAQGGFVVVWEERNPAGGSANLAMRAIGLPGGMGPRAVLTFFVGNEQRPAVAYNSTRQEIAVAYASDESGTLDVRLLRYTAASLALISGHVVSKTGSAEDYPTLAYDASHQEWLVAWVDDAGGNQRRIKARRVDGATGNVIDNVYVLEDVLSSQTRPALLLLSGGDWLAAWEHSTSTTDLRTARFPSGTNTPVITLATAAVGVGDAPTPALAAAPSAEQYRVVFSDAATSPRGIAAQRFLENGASLGPLLPAPIATGAQTEPRVVYAVAPHEHFSVFLDARNGKAQVYGLRQVGGSTDEDNDTLPNAWEVAHGLDPLSAEGDDGAGGDPDDDGLTNTQERALNTDPQNTDTDGDGLEDGREDADRDGVVDATETDPAALDSDADHFDDGAEVWLDSNPRSGASMPPAALYRVQAPAFSAGVAAAVKVYAAVPADGNYVLHLNSPVAAGWIAPTGWSAALEGAAARTLAPGSHVFTLQVTPQAGVGADAALADFAFRLTGPGNINEAIAAQLVCDSRTTLANGPLSAQELARKFAPVIRLHRTETFAPAPIDLTLAQATLRPSDKHKSIAPPSAADLALFAQTQAQLDLSGTSALGLRNVYSAVAGDYTPTIYYTVSRLGTASAVAGASANDIVIQYYVHFFADTWGADAAGGHTHEGDWEVFQVLLSSEGTPYRATASQQMVLAQSGGADGAASVAWEEVECMGATHTVLFAGQGGHSLYFRAGATRYASGLEVHDGLGLWMLPQDGAQSLVATDYPQTRGMNLVALGRLREASAAPWLAYAGRWGQDAFPAEADDVTPVGTREGARGPVFLGNTLTAAQTTGVRSVWLDPWAWAQRSPDGAEPAGTLRGTLPEALHAATVVALDSRGRVYRTETNAGAFALTVPAGVCALAVVDVSDLGVETLRATFRTATTWGTTLLIPVDAGAETDLGALAIDGTALTGSDPYAAHDADGDGTPDAIDADADDDLIPNAADADVLGDGFDDMYQAQDADDDGVMNYYDADDDGNGTPETQNFGDVDGDGFINAVDLDIDNDGFSNVAEIAAGSSPKEFFDRPGDRMGDMNGDNKLNVLDVQGQINILLGFAGYQIEADCDRNGLINVRDVQKVINVILGLV